MYRNFLYPLRTFKQLHGGWNCTGDSEECRSMIITVNSFKTLKGKDRPHSYKAFGYPLILVPHLSHDIQQHGVACIHGVIVRGDP